MYMNIDNDYLLKPGTFLYNGAYRVEQQLASGCCSNTYLVRNLIFDELFVMKEFFIRKINSRNGTKVTVNSSEDQILYDNQLKKFEREAKRLRKLDNPHIIKVYDLFEENDTAYYMIGYIKGQTLADYLRSLGQPISEQQSWQIMGQLLNALEAIHSVGILHLDINPTNIMLDDNWNPILIGFGACKLVGKDQNMSFSSAITTTNGYTPSELMNQDISHIGPWTDFYALGATLYHIRTLQNPPSINDLLDDASFIFPNDMSMKMQSLIRWMMEPKRTSRPQTINEIKDKYHPFEYYSDSNPKFSLPRTETDSIPMKWSKKHEEKYRRRQEEEEYRRQQEEEEYLRRQEEEDYRRQQKEKELLRQRELSYKDCHKDCCPSPTYTESAIKASQKQNEKFLHVPEKNGFIKRIRSIFNHHGDKVNSAVFAPANISKGDDMMVQVFIYKDEETNEIVVEALNADRNTAKRKYVPLNFKLMKGDKVSIQLNIKQISIPDNIKELIWQGKYTSTSFFVGVPKNFEKNKLLGEVTLSVNGLLLGQLQFITEISDNVSVQGTAEIIPKLYKKVFISYSHKDAEIANVIAESFKALGTVDYFYDRHTLTPGELFEKKIFQYIDDCDLFILCWSQNAKESEWVKKERERAFSGALTEPPKLRLYPINIIPYANPPEDMINSFHFTDYNKN